jgi:hypothetical protein
MPFFELISAHGFFLWLDSSALFLESLLRDAEIENHLNQTYEKRDKSPTK